MASHNANGVGGGNDHSSREAYSGRYRNRPHPKGNNARPEFPPNHSTSIDGQNPTQGQHSHDRSNPVPNADGSVSSASYKPRRGRGFAGAPRSVYRRQPQSDHQFTDNNEQHGYTPRGDSHYVHDVGLSSRNLLSQDVRQHTQDVNFSEIHTRNPQTLSAMGMMYLCKTFQCYAFFIN